MTINGQDERVSWWRRLTTLPIFHGPLRGRRWLIATRSSFFRGTYEVGQTRAFAASVKACDVVYDVGAHYGYYTLLASDLVGPLGKVLAFEPSPANLSYLRTHVAINECRNVSIMETAISNYEGKARFENRTGSGRGHLSAAGLVEVPVTSLDAVVRSAPPPSIMKIDVEGAEMEVLSGARRLLASHQPVIFLSTHSAELHTACQEFLRGFGYAFEPLDKDDFVARVK